MPCYERHIYAIKITQDLHLASFAPIQGVLDPHLCTKKSPIISLSTAQPHSHFKFSVSSSLLYYFSHNFLPNSKGNLHQIVDVKFLPCPKKRNALLIFKQLTSLQISAASIKRTKFN